MLPTLVVQIPEGTDWLYEVKYDGFRALIYIDKESVKIISRNLNVLNDQFPDVVDGFTSWSKELATPLILDGELCVLENALKGNFDEIQKRGRLKSSDKIAQAKRSKPVTFMAFDLLMENETYITHLPFLERKERLRTITTKMSEEAFVKLVEPYESGQELWELVSKSHGEGIIAKKKESLWVAGQRTSHWVKIKNMKVATFFIIAYDEKNAFFHIGCVYEKQVKLIGKVGQGFSKTEKEALVATVKKNSVKATQGVLYVNPGICIEVEFLELSKNEVRHPKFRRFRFDQHWEDCTWEALLKLEHS